MKSIDCFKFGFIFYIGYKLAEYLDEKYRNKIINIIKNIKE